MTDYRWLAESVLMTSATLARDLRAAIEHARTVPGDITPAQADRLGPLAEEIDSLEGAKV
jgi:hypothetical protein